MMFEIGEDFSWRIREKRARKRLSVSAASVEIGISRRTLSLIEVGGEVRVTKTVYKKLVDWLVNGKIYKEG